MGRKKKGGCIHSSVYGAWLNQERKLFLTFMYSLILLGNDSLVANLMDRYSLHLLQVPGWEQSLQAVPGDLRPGSHWIPSRIPLGAGARTHTHTCAHAL